MSECRINGQDDKINDFEIKCLKCGGTAKLHVQESSIQGYHDCSVWLVCKNCGQQETLAD
jgi:hypothetical protein